MNSDSAPQADSKATGKPESPNIVAKTQVDKEPDVTFKPPYGATANSAKVIFSRANSSTSATPAQSTSSLVTPPALPANRSVSSLISYELDHGPNSVLPGTNKGSLYEMLHEQPGPRLSLRPEDKKWLRENGYTAVFDHLAQHEMTQRHNSLVMKRRQTEPVVPLFRTSLSLSDICSKTVQAEEKPSVPSMKTGTKECLALRQEPQVKAIEQEGFMGTWSSVPGSLGINAGLPVVNAALTPDDIKKARAMLDALP